ESSNCQLLTDCRLLLLLQCSTSSRLDHSTHAKHQKDADDTDACYQITKRIVMFEGTEFCFLHNDHSRNGCSQTSCYLLHRCIDAHECSPVLHFRNSGCKCSRGHHATQYARHHQYI